MPREMDDQEFRRLRAEITEQLRAAWMHWTVFQGLRSSLPSYARRMNDARVFWSLTMNAHLEAVRIALCRVYDEVESAIGIRKWIEAFRDNFYDDAQHGVQSEWTLRCCCEPVQREEIEEDIRKLGADGEFEKLLRQRNTGIAHVSLKLTLRGESAFERFPLTRCNIDTLIERARNAVNRYGILFDGELQRAARR